MSRKKKVTKGNPARTQRRVESNTRIIDAYRASRSLRGLDPDDSWLMGAALDLKGRELDSPDPRYWPEDELAVLLVQVLPSMALLEDIDKQVLPDVAEDFLRFMADTGRWTPESMPTTQIGPVMKQLRGPIRSALNPSGKSLGGNIAAFAQSQGVDFSDPEAVQQFFDEYNSMSLAERTSISDGHGLPNDSTFGDPHRPHLSLVPDLPDTDWEDDDYGPFDDEDQLFSATDVWPSYLGEPEDIEALRDALPTERDEATDIEALGTELFRRVEHLLQWLEQSRPITATGALKLADARRLLSELGLRRSDARSMWDIPELAGPWRSLLALGAVILSPTRAMINPDFSIPLADRTPEDELRFRLAIGIGALHALLSPLNEDGPLLNPPFAWMALVKAAKPEGLIFTDPERGSEAETTQLVAAADLVTIGTWGLIRVEGGIIRCPEPLLPVLLELPEEFLDILDDMADPDVY